MYFLTEKLIYIKVNTLTFKRLGSTINGRGPLNFGSNTSVLFPGT